MGLYPDSLYGKKVKVLESTKKDFVGLEGVVLDETLKTLVVSLSIGKEKTLLKSALKLIEVEGKQVFGSEIMARSQDRLRGN